jgi:hemolysin activation/secretion protein
MQDKNLVIIVTVITSTILLSPTPGFSQPNFSSATTEVNRSMRKEVEKQLEKQPKKAPIIEEEKKEEAPKGPTFLLKKITLLGCETFPTEDFYKFTGKYENKEVSLADLDNLSKDIEGEYLKKGVIAACFVPPQDVKEGKVSLQIVEAHMGKLEISDTKYYSKKKIASYWGIRPGEVLQYYKISRALQIINKNPDREVKAMLHAGAKPGTTDVTLNTTSKLPIHLIGSLDREGQVSTGFYRYGYGVKHNNFLGLDDTFMTGFVQSKESTNWYAYHSLPVSSQGTSLLYGFTRAAAFPKKDFISYDLRSYSKDMSAFIHQDLFKRDEYFGDSYIGLDYNDRVVYTNAGDLNRDRLTTLTGGSRVAFKMPSSITYIKPEFSQGLNLLGARRKSPLSSRLAENTFSKFNLDIQHRQIIAPYSQLMVKASMQIASEKLTPQQEFTLGGMNSVRGYPYADFYADNAIQTNVEYLVSPAFLPKELKLPFDKKPLKDAITGLLFFDYGYGTKRGDIQGEQTKFQLASVGTGIRFNLYDQVLLRLEWGFILPMGDKALTAGGDSRFHISIDIEEKILQYHKDKTAASKL